MPIRFVTGRAAEVRRRLTDELRRTLADGSERAMLMLVPEQYTLQAELDAMDELDLNGSFRFQVLSPARLVSRIFTETGRPTATRIDDRGRAVMMYLALQSLSESLSWYRGAQHWPGFAELMVEQVREFKQSGETPDKLSELATERFDGSLRMKLMDIAAIWRAYDASLGGQYADDDDELAAALERASQASFLAGADVWVHGFEMISSSLVRTLAALSGCAHSVTMMLALENDGKARDFRAFQPVQDAFERLVGRLNAESLPWTRTYLPSPSAAGGEIAHFARELMSYPTRKWPDPPRQLQLAALQNPLAEAMFAAALSRQLVMRQGWRWRDVKVVLGGLDGYRDALERAFALYEVPLFLEGGRMAARHPAAEHLLMALRLAIYGFQLDDARMLMRTGYTDLSDDECDLLLQYAVGNGLKGSGWTKPLARGGAAAIAAAEPLRARLVAPVLALREDLRVARGADGQLKAIWRLMEATRAYEKLCAERERLTNMNLPLRANESAQVWNRLVGALDQMHELLGAVRVPARDLYELLRQSLMASEIKPLPQSADAVEAGSLNRLRGHPVKALILLGMSDDAGGDRGAFLPDERAALTSGGGMWLHPDAGEREMLKMLDLKAALSLADRYVVVTYPMSGPSGEPRAAGALVQGMKQIFPKLAERGGVLGEYGIDRMLLSAPGAALQMALPTIRASEGETGVARAAYEALLASPAYRNAALAAGKALHHRIESQPLPPAVAQRLYGGPESVSASRLELYAACPFRHFVRYGIHPAEPKQYEFTPENRGSFLHEALDRYAKAADVAGRDIERSLAIMDEVTESLLKPLMDGPLGDDPVMLSYAGRLKRIARRTARSIASQFEDSKFEQLAAESAFSRFDPARLLGDALEEPLSIEGRIDRIDRWVGETGVWLRVVDYKTGGMRFNPAEVYFGLQLQLILYLAAALTSEGGRPAGAFYFRVDDPLVPTFERDPAIIEQERAMQARLNGLVVAEPDVIAAMSPEPERVMQIKLNKDGSIRKGSLALTEAQFMALARHALSSAAHIAAEIRAGETGIAPAQVGKRLSCAYCDYAAICAIDPRVPGGEPRVVPGMKLDEMMALIEGSRDDNTDREDEV